MANNTTTIVIGILVVIIIALIAVITLGSSSSKTTTIQSTSQTTAYNIPSTSGPTTSIPLDIVVPASPASANVSKLFISQAQAVSILGPDGIYGVYQRTNTSQLQYAIPSMFAQYNVTAEYNMTYNDTNSNGVEGNILAEIIFPTNSAASMYSYVLSQYPYFNKTLITSQGAVVLNNALNQTMPGLVYSSSTFMVPPQQINQTGTTNVTETNPLVFQVLLGRTNSSLVLISILKLNSTEGVNATTLAQLVNQNLN